MTHQQRVIRCLVALVAWLGMMAANSPGVNAQGPHRVGLVVDRGGGQVITRCVTFAEPEITGLKALIRSGLEVVYTAPSGIGAAVCRIDHAGCPPDDCFCQCRGATCVYWSYWHLEGGRWLYGNVGAGGHLLRDGDVEGWHWGTQEAPPVVAFDAICRPPATSTPLPPTLMPPTPVPSTRPPPTAAPPTATPAPPSTRFVVSPGRVPAGACARLTWSVRGAQAVFLEGEGVAGEGAREVCPAQARTYELRVVSAYGEEVHTVTLDVIPLAATEVSGATPVRAATTAPTLTVAPPRMTATVVATVAAATAADIHMPAMTPAATTRLLSTTELFAPMAPLSAAARDSTSTVTGSRAPAQGSTCMWGAVILGACAITGIGVLAIRRRR